MSDLPAGYDAWRTREPDLPPEPKMREVVVTFQLYVTCQMPFDDEGNMDSDARFDLAKKIETALWDNDTVGSTSAQVDYDGYEEA